jgi:uncharacterized membrane protein YukC
MKLEEILKNDMIDETNPFAFSRLEAVLEERQRQLIPKKFAAATRLALCLVVAIIATNAYIVFSTQKNNINQQEAYQKFMSDNYYDVLADYYPQELFNK